MKYLLEEAQLLTEASAIIEDVITYDGNNLVIGKGSQQVVIEVNRGELELILKGFTPRLKALILL